KHLDISKDSLESSVKDPIPIPSESNDTFNGAWNSLLNNDKFQKALNDWCNLAQQNSMLSIYDENNKIRDCYKLSPSAITPVLPTDEVETDIQKRTKNKAKNDKTEHRMERCEKTRPNRSQRVNQANRKVKQSKSKSTPTESKSTPRR
ncbi:hypothetical protein Tco_1261461, partial [Tanacetum coccineum]